MYIIREPRSKIPEGESGCSQQSEEQGRGGCQLGNVSKNSWPGQCEQEEAYQHQENREKGSCATHVGHLIWLNQQFE